MEKARIISVKKEYRKPNAVLVSFQTKEEIAWEHSAGVEPNPFGLSPEEAGTGKAVFGENGQITHE